MRRRRRLRAPGGHGKGKVSGHDERREGAYLPNRLSTAKARRADEESGGEKRRAEKRRRERRREEELGG
jgi:hypothetical protein